MNQFFLMYLFINIQSIVFVVFFLSLNNAVQGRYIAWRFKQHPFSKIIDKWKYDIIRPRPCKDGHACMEREKVRK